MCSCNMDWGASVIRYDASYNDAIRYLSRAGNLRLLRGTDAYPSTAGDNELILTC